MNQFDLIIGIHSIILAMQNPNRSWWVLHTTKDALEKIKKELPQDIAKKLNDSNLKIFDPEKLQNEGKKLFQKLGHSYKRIPGQSFLTAEGLNSLSVPDILSEIKEKKHLKMICLDQVTDIHNAAAILRTAAFYQVDFLIIGQKGNFSFNPGLFHLSSGAAEFVPVVSASRIPALINKFTELGVETIGLSEDGKSFSEIESESSLEKQNVCLVFGKEDTGISFAVKRNLKHLVKLESLGKIQTLNVSVAAAISMEKIFNAH